MDSDYKAGLLDGLPSDEDVARMQLGDIFSPADDRRFRECPECAGMGEAIEGGGCGVCLGDGYLWIEGVAPIRLAHITRFIDHSGLGHTCWRCRPYPAEPADVLPDYGT